MNKTMWIVSVTHGEYDDFTDTPVAVAPDYDTACLIGDALEKKEQPYFNQIMKNGFEHWIDFDFGVNLQEVPLVQL